MLARHTANVNRWDVRVGQIAIGLLLLQPLADYVLTIVGIMPVVVAIFPLDPLAVAILVLALLLLVYLRVHVGRRWFFRLYADWVSNWPHKRIFILCFVGLLLWYLLSVTMLRGDVALFRFGYSELIRLTILEVYVAGGQAKAERDRVRATIK